MEQINTDNKYANSEITQVIIGCFYNVFNSLGYGFFEKVYQNEMVFELKNQGLLVESQKPLKVFYKELLVGEYYANILLRNLIVVELKAAEILIEEYELQLLNYLKSKRIETGLLLNFGKKPEIKRKIVTNDRKNH